MPTRVGRLEELPEGRGLVVEVGGTAVALFRVGDEVHALEDECPHRGASLGEGEVRDGAVHCSAHAWPFDLATGRCRDVEGAAARRFPVRVAGGEVFLEL